MFLGLKVFFVKGHLSLQKKVVLDLCINILKLTITECDSAAEWLVREPD